MASATVVLRWADGEYTFALNLDQIEELQRLCGTGIGALTQRVLIGEAYVGDLVHTIRLGLIGGGTSPVRAQELVRLYVERQPLATAGDPSSPLATAQTILAAIWLGVEPQEDGDAEKPKAGTKAGSTSRRSRRPRSTKASPPETSGE